MTVASRTRTRVLEGFDDPAFGRESWNALLDAHGVDLVTLTWDWQRSWWDAYGRGELLLILAEKDGDACALAPFYAEDGLVTLVGTGAVCLDIVGDADADVLEAILETAAERVAGFYGFCFYYLPVGSPTEARLAEAAERLGLSCYPEHEMPAATIDLAGQPEQAVAAASKKRLLRAEAVLRRDGDLRVRHFDDGRAIEAQLDEFFDQHVARWAGTDSPSPFEDPAERDRLRRRVRSCAGAGWQRFTRIDWSGRPIAFHYGSCFRGRYTFWIPTFAVDLARSSPGQVLQRQVLLAAISEGAHTFDFGLGDQAYKLRFATHVGVARAFGLYRE